MPKPSAFDPRLRRIDSRQNTHVKRLRRAFSDAAPNEQGEIAVEGMHLLEEAIRSGLRLTTVFFSESAHERAHKLLPQLSAHSETLLLPDSIFARAVPTESPQGVAALVRVKPFSLDEVLAAQPALLVITVALQDPGNLGTIARSSEAFGATGLLLGESTVSQWNWKAIRASAGSLFRLPAVKVELAKILPDLNARGIRLLATTSHKGKPISDADLRRPAAILIGSEGSGLPRHLLAHADELVTISHSAKVESLNAAIAASIMLYDAARQRKQ